MDNETFQALTLFMELHVKAAVGIIVYVALATPIIFALYQIAKQAAEDADR